MSDGAQSLNSKQKRRQRALSRGYVNPVPRGYKSILVPCSLVDRVRAQLHALELHVHCNEVTNKKHHLLSTAILAARPHSEVAQSGRAMQIKKTADLARHEWGHEETLGGDREDVANSHNVERVHCAVSDSYFADGESEAELLEWPSISWIALLALLLFNIYSCYLDGDCLELCFWMFLFLDGISDAFGISDTFVHEDFEIASDTSQRNRWRRKPATTHDDQDCGVPASPEFGGSGRNRWTRRFRSERAEPRDLVGDTGGSDRRCPVDPLEDSEKDGKDFTELEKDPELVCENTSPSWECENLDFTVGGDFDRRASCSVSLPGAQVEADAESILMLEGFDRRDPCSVSLPNLHCGPPGIHLPPKSDGELLDELMVLHAPPSPPDVPWAYRSSGDDEDNESFSSSCSDDGESCSSSSNVLSQGSSFGGHHGGISLGPHIDEVCCHSSFDTFSSYQTRRLCSCVSDAMWVFRFDSRTQLNGLLLSDPPTENLIDGYVAPTLLDDDMLWRAEPVLALPGFGIRDLPESAADFETVPLQIEIQNASGHILLHDGFTDRSSLLEIVRTSICLLCTQIGLKLALGQLEWQKTLLPSENSAAAAQDSPELDASQFLCLPDGAAMPDSFGVDTSQFLSLPEFAPSIPRSDFRTQAGHETYNSMLELLSTQSDMRTIADSWQTDVLFLDKVLGRFDKFEIDQSQLIQHVAHLDSKCKNLEMHNAQLKQECDQMGGTISNLRYINGRFVQKVQHLKRMIVDSDTDEDESNAYFEASMNQAEINENESLCTSHSNNFEKFVENLSQKQVFEKIALAPSDHPGHPEHAEALGPSPTGCARRARRGGRKHKKIPSESREREFGSQKSLPKKPLGCADTPSSAPSYEMPIGLESPTVVPHGLAASPGLRASARGSHHPAHFDQLDLKKNFSDHVAVSVNHAENLSAGLEIDDLTSLNETDSPIKLADGGES